MLISKIYQLLPAIICSFLALGTGAQLPVPATPVYAHYHATNSTLPTDLIYKVHADHNGYLWLATDLGLLRYNGRTFTLINTGKPEDFVSTCIVSGKQLWLFAYSGHTVAIDLNTHKIINTDSIYGLQRLPSAGSMFLLGNRKNKDLLLLYKQGNVTVGLGLDSRKTWSKLVSSEDKAKDLLQQYRFSDNQQQQLFPTLTDIFRHNCYGLAIKDSFITIGNKIFSTAPAKPARLLFNGDEYGISTNIMGFARRNDDLYLGGLHDIGLCRIRGYFSLPRRQQVLEHLLPSEAVTGVERDYLGNIWVSTHGNGLFLFPYSENNTLYYNKSNGLYSDKVSSVNHFPNGITALGYDDAVLDFYHTASPGPQRYILPVKNDIRDVRHVEKLASSWLAFTPNEAFYAPSPHAALPGIFRQAVAEGPGIDVGYKSGRQIGDSLYFVSGNGIVSMDSRGRVRRENVQDRAFPKRLCLLPLSDTLFFVGTVRGCYRNTKALPYLQDAQVNAIDTVAGQLLWATNLGVYAVPLHKAWNSRLLRKITSESCITIKHDDMFIYLRNGDDLVVIQNSDMKPVLRFSCRDYIIPFRLARFNVYNNYLILAGNLGVFYIPRQNFLTTPGSPKPIMHILCSLNGKTPSDSAFTCRYRDGLSILFELDILDYKNEKHEMSCRIFRNDKEQYRETNLDERGAVSLYPSAPGRYRIEYHVRLAGRPAEYIMSYRLLVTPLWYQQWWCMPLLIMLSGAVVLYVLYRLYVHKLKEDRRKLKQKLHLQELESQSLLGQLKPHFIFNILTPLQGFFMSGEKIKGLNYLDSFSRLMRGMLNAIRGRYAPLSSEITFIRHYLNIQQERFDHCFSFSINIADTIDADQCIVPTLMLQPLVENAIEHGIKKTGDNGVIAIMVEDLGNAIAIKVKDNGKGLPPHFKMKDNHALTIITERMQLMKKVSGTGKFTIYNNEGEDGTTSLLILTKNKPIS